MKTFNLRMGTAALVLTVLAALGSSAGVAQAQIPVTDQPLFTTAGVPPLMMMVMSRDEQLFNKAYPDYTDLDGDGLLDTTYQDRFDYSGYFDPALCYTYSGTVFVAAAAATGTLATGQKYPHHCSSQWSGNFMNWLSMSRLDMLRFVMYGGLRSTDATTTVLERAPIPNDLHAWVKVYTNTDITNYTPYSQDVTTPGVSFCNATFNSSTNPIIRAAKGTWTEWAATALSQCNWREDANGGSTACTGGSNSSCDDPIKATAMGGGAAGDFNARVQVCGTSASLRESFCQKYLDASNNASFKPTGLLQSYGEKGLMRFGLLSGTYSKPRSGGVLRRNIGLFAGNTGTQNAEGCAPGDEVNVTNGRFCNQSGTTEGVVKTMNTFKLTQWNGVNNWSDCNTYSILNRQGGGSTYSLNNPGAGTVQNCSGWGNPLSEMYAEALRYIAKGPSDTPSTAFAGGTDLAGMQTPGWIDPYGPATNTANGSGGGNPYCASCSILVLASGLNSFDSDEVPAVTALSMAANTATTKIGVNEGISGNYLVGRNATGTPGNLAVGLAADTYADLCTSKGVADLSLVRGICPDIPSQEGSYLMSGLAWKAWTTDLRPGLLNSKGQPKPVDAWNQVQTYSVALAENLPKFQIPVGTSTITLAPLCQANNTGGAVASDGGWRSCFLGSVTIGPKQSIVSPFIPYGRALANDGSEGSFTWVWEDSLWGNDHDNDVVTMLTYCVGNKCTNNTHIPLGTAAPKLCVYVDAAYGGAEFCPTTTTGSFASTFDKTISSVRVPAGYTLTLYLGTGQSGTAFNFTADTTPLAAAILDKARSWRITGGTVPPPVPTYAGYDICYRTTSTGNDSSNAACGATGTPTVTSTDVFVRIENLSAYAGNAMLTGYNIINSNNDGLKRLTLRPGGTDSSILTQVAQPPASWYKPMVIKYSAGAATAGQLENPLFYAAKYGGFSKPDAAHPGKRRHPLATEMPATGDWEALDTAGNPTTTPSNYFLVRDPARLKDQLQKVFDAVLANSSPAGSVAASASRFTVGQTLAYQASYDSNNWIGDLKGFFLNSNGSLGAQAWAAAAMLPAGARDDIWIGTAPTPTSTTFIAKKFTRGNLDAWMQTALTAAGPWVSSTASVDNLIAYLKGDQTNESPSGLYRKRDATSRLGDLVNSSPQVSYPFSFGYDQLSNPAGCGSACTGSYAAFVAAKTRTTVFAGANDGMLHAFNGAANGGQELFAYIPNAVISKLGTLPKPGYVHTFFVDGTPAIGDAYLGAWKTVLVSSAGAGAHAVFALDVTNPASFTASSLLWEFNSTVDGDMGQFTGIPTPPTLTSDGKWVTTFGNGYNGASNKAKLFVLNLSDGSKITTDDITDAANAAPNGMSTATIIDAGGVCPSGGPDVCSDGVGDTIYAGDYRGNVWKFVLSSGGAWRLNPSTPVFKAVDSAGHQQPITSGMFAIKNPLGGVIVYFGTGKYLTTTDNNPLQLQSDGQPLVNAVYAIWDNESGTPVVKGDLQQQQILDYDPILGSYTLTQSVFGYRTPEFTSGKMGWYLNLTVAGASPDPLQGLRVLAAPTGLLNKLFVNIFRPIGEVCLPAGINSLLELDLLNGAAAFPTGDGSSGTGTGSGTGGQDIGNGAPLGAPNPVVAIPPHTGIPPIGCSPTDPSCVPDPTKFWCTPGVPGYPRCADPPWCQPSMPGYPGCTPPPECHPASAGPPPVTASPGYPYCNLTSQCSVIPNAGTPVGNQQFQCRASWRQLR